MDKQKRLIRNGTVVFPDQLLDVSLLVAEGKVAAILDKDAQPEDDWKITDAGGKIIMPGMIDTHNHMADPGPFRFREDWYHGSCSSASGGITTICQGMELIKEARNNGVSVYVETCPHYLIFDHTVLRTRKSFAKCTPPFRSRASQSS